MEESQGGGENVKVVVRVRPLNSGETKEGYRMITKVNTIDGTIKVEMPKRDANNAETPAKIFTFDTVFAPEVKQVDVYNRVARPIVCNVLEGYNGTIFAYGQTGTGKTFTMEGDRSVPELKGIIPNSFAHIFGHIAKSGDDKNFLVRVSYLEIYNEEVQDLLGKDQQARLEVKERPDVGVYVKDLSTAIVNNADDMDKIMTLGNKNRSVGATMMNAHSSRSHAIFTTTIECAEKGADKQTMFRVGKLHLVDLAGSERQSKTGASGQRLKEATKINLSLSTLGNVISALVDGKSTHVPYRNSKLTRLLQDSLGGNSKTLMFANVGPADYNYDETISTLRYANRAKSIKNKAKINEDPKDALMKQYQKEIEELKRLLEDGSEDITATEDEDGEASEGERDDDNEAENQKDELNGNVEEGQQQTKTKSIKVKSKEKTNKKKVVTRSAAEVLEIKTKIEEEKKRLLEEKDMAEGERRKLAENLAEHEAALATAQAEQDAIKQKLINLEKKIIVGGENLLDKAEEQERMLGESAKELEETIATEQKLREKLEAKEAERLDIEEKYSSLQEEAAGKTRKLKKVWGMLQSAKSELNDVQAEQQREMEGLLDSVRQLTRELRREMLLVDSFIPVEYQEVVEQHIQWNEEIGEWQLRCVAYTGNNMRKSSQASQERSADPNDLDLASVYLSYAEAGLGDSGGHSRPRTGRTKSARPKSSKLRSRR